MLRYETYQRKVMKLARVLDWFRAHRVPIAVISASLLLLLIGFLSVRGILLEPLTLSADRTEYGTPVTYRAKALFRKVQYEYRGADSADPAWIPGTPTMPGSYLVRPFSVRTFGARQEGDPVSLQIDRRQLNLAIREEALTYGDDPAYEANLATGDRVETLIFSREYCLSEEDPYFYPEGDAIRWMPLDSSSSLPLTVLDAEASSVAGSGVQYLPIGTVHVEADYTTLRILDRNGEDVTPAYRYLKEEADLPLLPRPVDMTTASEKRNYDGTPLSAPTMEAFGLREGDTAYPSTEFPELTEVGTIMNIVCFRVLSGSGEDVSAFYVHGLFEFGFLTVSPRPLTVTTPDDSAIYSDQPFRSKQEDLLLSGDGLVPGHVLQVRAQAEQINVGNYENTFTVAVYDRDNNDMTANYDISYRNGTLSILPRPVTVTTGSEEKTYDGTLLTKLEADANNLVTGHFCFLLGGSSWESPIPELSNVAVVPGLIGVGEIENCLSVRIKRSSDGEDVTDNYRIIYEYGTLKVTPRRLEITVPAPLTKLYDGTPLGYRLDDLTISGDGLVSGHGIELRDWKELTNAGVMPDCSGTFLIGYLGEDGKLWDDATANYDIVLSGNASLTVERRDLEITVPAPLTKLYDGTPLGYRLDDLTISGDGLASGQGIELRDWKELTNAGVMPDCSGTFLIGYLDEDGNIWDDATANYDIVLSGNASLTVERRKLVVITPSVSKIYDGTPLISTWDELDWESEGDGVAPTDEVQISAAADLTQAGTVENRVTVRVMSFGADNLWKNVSGNYEILYRYGTLTVLKRPLKVITHDLNKGYDGTPLYCRPDLPGNMTIEQVEINGVLQNGIVKGQVAHIASYTSQTEVGSSPNVIELWITEGSRSVTSNYEIEYEYGTLTVTPRRATVTSGSGIKTYDGTPLTDDKVEAGNLLSGHRLVAQTGGSQTEVGTSENVILSWMILDESDKDVSGQYEVTVTTGTLTVMPIPIAIQFMNINRVYDGGTLTHSGLYRIRSGGLLPGDTLSVSVDGALTSVGTLQCTVSISVQDSSGKDVTSHYRFDVSGGSLTYEKITLTVASESREKTYDGAPLTGSEVMIVQGTLLPGHTFSGSATGTRTEPGVSVNAIDPSSCKVQNAAGEDVTDLYYTFVFLEGTLTVRSESAGGPDA